MTKTRDQSKNEKVSSIRRLNHQFGQGKDDAVGFVLGKGRDDFYEIQLFDGSIVQVEIPEPLHYSVGDEVLRQHVYRSRCFECGNDKLYDERNEEYYCPAGHDN